MFIKECVTIGAQNLINALCLAFVLSKVFIIR